MACGNAPLCLSMGVANVVHTIAATSSTPSICFCKGSRTAVKGSEGRRKAIERQCASPAA